MKLTEREKALLFLLGLIMLGVGGVYFIFIPTLKSYEEAKISLEESLQKQLEAQLLLDRAVTIDGQLEEARREADEVSGPFMEQLDMQYIDTWLHQIAQDTGVEITRNTMSEPSVGSPQVYMPRESVLTYPIKDYFENSQRAVEEDQEKEQSEDTPASGEGESQIVQVSIQLGVTGNQDQILNLLYKLAKSGVYLRVEQFSLGAQQTQLSLTLYMIEKTKDPAFDYPFAKPSGKDRLL